MARGQKMLGLDIGSHSIKLVELRPYKKTYSLVKFGIGPLSPEAIVDGAIMNSGIVSSTIASLAKKTKVKTKDVAVSISGHSVIIKKINMPFMSDSELQDSIQWEAEQYIPFDINDVNIDVQVLVRDKNSPSGQMEVLLVAAKKELINDFCSVVKEAGLNPAIMDVCSFAMQNAFELNYTTNPGEVVMLADIGASFVNLVVLKDSIPVFTRDISDGGNHFTEEVQKHLNVSHEDAESLKINGPTGDKAPLQPKINEIIQGVSASMALEIQRSLDFYTATAVDDKVSKIYLSGGSCRIPGLAEIIQNKIRIPVGIMNPFGAIEIDPKVFDSGQITHIGSVASVAVGLALRDMGE